MTRKNNLEYMSDEALGMQCFSHHLLPNTHQCFKIKWVLNCTDFLTAISDMCCNPQLINKKTGKS